MAAVRAIFAGSGVIGQGNPAITEHPVTPAQCRAKLAERARRLRQPDVRENLRRQVHGAALRPGAAAPGGRQGLHRPVRVPGHPLHLSRGLGAGARGGRDLRGDRQAPVRRARMGGGLRRRARAARLPLRPGQGPEPERRGRAPAQGPQPGRRADQDLELRSRLPEGRLRRGQPQEPGLRRRRLVEMRLEHLPDRRFSGLPQPASASTT